MPRIIPVGYGEASIIITSGPGTAPYVTTLGVSLVGIDPEEYVQAANDIMSGFVSLFAGQVSNDCIIDRVVLQVGLGGGTSGSVASDNAPVPGGNSGEMAPLAMSVIARKVSADLGRRGRGRCFLPCTLNRSDVNEAGDLVPTTIASYDAKWNAFLLNLATAIPGRAMSPVILHSDGGAPTVITGGTISPKVGWIRKRIR